MVVIANCTVSMLLVTEIATQYSHLYIHNGHVGTRDAFGVRYSSTCFSEYQRAIYQHYQAQGISKKTAREQALRKRHRIQDIKLKQPERRMMRDFFNPDEDNLYPIPDEPEQEESDDDEDCLVEQITALLERLPRDKQAKVWEYVWSMTHET